MYTRRILIIFVQILILIHITCVDSLSIFEKLKQARQAPGNKQIGIFDKIVLGDGLSGRAVAKTKTTDRNSDDPVFAAGLDDENKSKYKVCADIVFANDGSCSLGAGVKTDQVDLIVAIVNKIAVSGANGARVGAFSYGHEVDTKTKMDFIPEANVSTILKGLSKIERSLNRCRTMPYRAMSMSMGYFKGPRDRDDQIYKDVLVFVGDGWTSPVRTRKQNQKEAKKLKKENVEILWIKTQAKEEREKRKQIKNGGKAIDIEILPIVEDPNKIFQYPIGDAESVAEEVSRYLASRYVCGE